MNILSKFLEKILSVFNSDINTNKSKIRLRIKKKKKKLSLNKRNLEAEKVFGKIESMPEFKSANNVLVYWSMTDELPSHNFVIKWSKQKQILLPIVKDDEMYIKPFIDKDRMIKGAYGIWEPDNQNGFENTIDLAIIPGIAFDKNKNRLGRGKGFYDRFLNNDHFVKIGVCYDLQLLKKIPVEPFDAKMDIIITTSKTII